VICERGNLSLSYYPLPFQNPRSPGTSPLGLASLKRKNLPIVVTLGGIGSCYASLALYLIAFTPSYKLCDNITTEIVADLKNAYHVQHKEPSNVKKEIHEEHCRPLEKEQDFSHDSIECCEDMTKEVNCEDEAPVTAPQPDEAL
jgi:hypothetical protein